MARKQTARSKPSSISFDRQQVIGILLSVIVAAAAWYVHVMFVSGQAADVAAELDRLETEVVQLQARLQGGDAGEGLERTLAQAQAMDALLPPEDPQAPLRIAAGLANQADAVGLTLGGVSPGETESAAPLIAYAFDVSINGSRPGVINFLDRLRDQETLYTIDRFSLDLNDEVGVSFRLLAWTDGAGGIAEFDPENPEAVTQPDDDTQEAPDPPQGD